MQRLNERKEQIQSNQKIDHSSDLEELKLQVEEMLERRLEAEGNMQTAREQLDANDTRMRELEQLRQAAEQNALEVRNELEKVRLECQALDIRRQALIAQLCEVNLTLKEVLES